MENANLNIEQTLNEVKEGIMNNTMTKWLLIIVWVVLCLFGELTGGRGFGK